VIETDSTFYSPPISAILALIGLAGLFVSFFGLSVWIAALIAREALKKGRSWHAFFWLSFLSPLVIFIIVATISPEGSHTPADSKKCPKCAEYIKFEANFCKHCGNSI
jgi:apolipoprotein N-acyltransferase